MGWRDDWRRYRSTAPIEVKEGIKVKSKRGPIGDTWWSKRWVNVLESFGWENRLARGRRYARRGQVIDFKLHPGKVTARVQGTRSTPYSVTIEIKPFQEKEWNQVIDAMAQQAVFAAKLLAGEMPQNIEETFKAAGISLFPKSARDITTQCSCPDSANPCKHIAAVYYILAEEFDRDPFMLFNLRGRTQEEITSSLRKKRTMGSEDRPKLEAILNNEKMKNGRVLAISMSDFWTGEALEAFSLHISPPEVSGAIIKHLGSPPFWDVKDDFEKIMSDCYAEISRCAIEAAYGELAGLKKKEKRP